MKEAIIRFIEQRLVWARKYPKNANTYCHQAFGAVEFYIDNCENANDYDEICTLWEQKRQEFWNIQWEATCNDET